MKKNKTYYIVAGVNGVGKSTYIKWRDFEKKFDIIIDPDRAALEEGSLIAGCRKALSEIDHCIEQGLSFCQETTLSGRQVINTIKNAKAHGYKVEIDYLSLDTAEECIARVAKRVASGGHYIPDDVIRRRFVKRFDHLARVLPICDSGFIVESFENYSYNMASLFFGGKLFDLNVNECKWVSEFLAYYSRTQERNGSDCKYVSEKRTYNNKRFPEKSNNSMKKTKTP